MKYVSTYTTDFGTVRLADCFVKEAAARWPGVEEWEQWNEETEEFDAQSRPNWDAAVLRAMTEHVALYAPATVNTLKQIGL